MDIPVSFKLAKLLKEKEFNEPIKQRYFIAENIDSDRFPFLQEECALYNWNNYDDFSTSYYSAPTIIDVIMWLYEKHGIWIRVTPLPYSDNLTHWRWEHMSVDYSTRNMKWKKQQDYMSPIEAYSAAIEYVLTKLI